MLPNIWPQQAGMGHSGTYHLHLEVCGFLIKSLSLPVKLQMGETHPAPSITSLKKIDCSLKPLTYNFLQL